MAVGEEIYMLLEELQQYALAKKMTDVSGHTISSNYISILQCLEISNIC